MCLRVGGASRRLGHPRALRLVSLLCAPSFASAATVRGPLPLRAGQPSWLPASPCRARPHAPQALPYSWTLFYVPMHFLTHELLLFFTSIWTTNIHDNLHAKVRPATTACRPQRARHAHAGRSDFLPSDAWLLRRSLVHAAPRRAWLDAVGSRCACPRPPRWPPPLQIAPVMGAGYHTIHHTLYNYNYGHYFTFVDRCAARAPFVGARPAPCRVLAAAGHRPNLRAAARRVLPAALSQHAPVEQA